MAADEVPINVHDHGIALDEQKKRVKCNYCGKVVSGFSRLKCHLGGIRGDVTPCLEVPAYVKESIRNKLLEMKRGNLSKEVGELYHPNLPWKRNWCYDMNGDHSKLEITQTAGSRSNKCVKMDSLSENSGTESVSFPKGRIGSGGAFTGIEDPSLGLVQKSIGRFFYETGIDVCVAKSPTFQNMINATLGCGNIGYKIPSCQELTGWILQNEVEEMQQYVKEVRNSWASTGCSILLDGWVDGKGRNLVNILVDCPRGAIYLQSSDISAFAGDVDRLQLFFDEILEEVGVKNVVQINTYSTSACMEAVGNQLMEKHRSFFWTVSASYCIELMLDKICTMGRMRGILENAKTITKFIQSSATMIKLLRKHTNGCDLVKPCKIKSALPFLTLENILSEKKNLKNMFNSSDWNNSTWASTREGKRVVGLVADRSFWTGAVVVLKATIPLVRALDLINDGDSQKLGYIYETMDQAKETIREEFENKKSQYIPLWKAIDEIWNKYLHSPLHAGGYFLNPILYYSGDPCIDAEVASGLLCCIVRMAEDRRVQDLMTLQFEEYRAAKGAFFQANAIDRRLNISPEMWWSKYGGHSPELQKLAIRILNQTSNGASKYDLRRSLAEKLLTEGTNCVEEQRLRDLAFVHYNLQLRNFVSGGNNNISVDEIDPIHDSIVDEEQEIVSQNGEPTWRDSDYGDASTSRGAISGEGPSSFRPRVDI
ncbi:unnamed protein product [Ilex paraguariensis]|uniref:DUF659 domain-containing protein n=1 Tax=Ilex paraguariensis TaxID=185542 RepID=A0ABC8RMC4_9AQUA